MTKPRTPTDEENRAVSRMLAENHDALEDSPYIDEPPSPPADPVHVSAAWHIRQFRQIP